MRIYDRIYRMAELGGGLEGKRNSVARWFYEIRGGGGLLLERDRFIAGHAISVTNDSAHGQYGTIFFRVPILFFLLPQRLAGSGVGDFFLNALRALDEVCWFLDNGQRLSETLVSERKKKSSREFTETL